MSNIIELLDNHSILIPEIQRDYAYGRKSEKEKVQSFLDDIFKALDGSGQLRLNYIYGVPRNNDTVPRGDDSVVLIDGQQRVTTLFLIRLYLAVNAGEKTDFCKRFSYATRTTTKAFCEYLSNEEKQTILKCDGNAPFSERLYADKGFLKKWRNDPTVYSMITVLDMIEKECGGKNVATLHENLKNIQFEFITLDGFKREEALYTAMNGRGKLLTEFEQIKAKIIEAINKDCEDIENDGGSNGDLENVEHQINNVWTPAFWDYALGEQKTDYDNAVKEHDKYLFNYFRYVMTMLWCEKNSVKKNEKPAAFHEVLDWFLRRPDDPIEAAEAKEARRLLLFAMKSISKSFGDWTKFDFGQWLSDEKKDKGDGKTNIFWEHPKKLIEECCKANEPGSFSLLARCLLWAFIVYQWKENQNQANGKTLRDYFVLMRDVYAASWDSNTPTSILKNPVEHLVAKAIMEFRKIADGGKADKKYECQQATFNADNKEKYRILNNFCTRGCSSNLSPIVQQNGYNANQATQFAANLDFLLDNCGDNGIPNIKALEGVGLPIWFVNDTRINRLYLPCTKSMLQSLFSMGSWTEDGYRDSLGSGRKYSDFLYGLTTNKLEVKNAQYDESNWLYYLEKYYSCFVHDEYFAAFDLTEDIEDDKSSLKYYEMRVVAGRKASSYQIFSPYLMAAFDVDTHNKDQVIKQIKTEAEKGIKLEEEDTKLVFIYDNNTHDIDKTKDVIKQLKAYIP